MIIVITVIGPHTGGKKSTILQLQCCEIKLPVLIHTERLVTDLQVEDRICNAMIYFLFPLLHPGLRQDDETG